MTDVHEHFALVKHWAIEACSCGAYRIPVDWKIGSPLGAWTPLSPARAAEHEAEKRARALEARKAAEREDP